MEITKDFAGGNIMIVSSMGDDIHIDREVRNDTGYFYWAFCVKGAQGRSLRFIFPNKTRVGRFGAAVSHDMINWRWSNTKITVNDGDGFTYTFSENDECVYFAHDMVYSEKRLWEFSKKNNIAIEAFTKTKKGRDVPCFSIGDGEKTVLITSRHHACESTGTHVLEGFAKGCLEKEIKGIRFLFVPFVDYDGVTDGDAGKNRLPYDHNRDYGEQAPIYNETAKLRALADSGKVLINFDFHSPHHDGGINDYPYIMKVPDDERKIYKRISEALREATENDKDSMLYTGKEDIEYGTQWNSRDVPNAKNYFLKRNILNTSITMETPYFGLDDNPFTQDRAINMGKHLYEAIYNILKEL